MQSINDKKGFGIGSVRGGQVSNLGKILILWGSILLSIAVLAMPSSASLEKSGTFEAWISPSSTENGTVWSMHSVDKGVVLQMAFDNSSSVGEGYGGAETDESGETGLVGYWKFNNDSAVGEDYNATNASLVYDYLGMEWIMNLIKKNKEFNEMEQSIY